MEDRGPWCGRSRTHMYPWLTVDNCLMSRSSGSQPHVKQMIAVLLFILNGYNKESMAVCEQEDRQGGLKK